ncbi:MAG TPA: abhydrolase domain-containing 18, partial [Nannocystis exedens]|nr:abhydrolase domain-containing 18 [Nannocystis exedens]
MNKPQSPPNRRTGVGARIRGAACQGADRLMYRALRQIFLKQPLPATTAAELDALLEAADRYSNPAQLRDPDRLLMPRGEFPRLAPVRSKRVRGGTLSHFRLPTPYRPIDPNYSDTFDRYEDVKNVHIFAWRHPKPAPLSILLLHGWAVGSRRLHEVEFSIGTLFRRLGLDVYFYVAPFHGLRRPTGFRSGELHPSIDIIRSNEAFVQTVQELRALITMIQAERSAPIGVMGSSLGGYTSALLASVDD